MPPATSIGTMRAFALEEFGKPGSLREIPAPKPSDGEILVRIRAAGVNPFDLFIVSGMAE